MYRKTRNTSDLTEPYYKQIERAVELVEQSATHYDVLGLERGATDAQIQRAYQRAVTVLNPLNFKSNADVPLEIQKRIDQAFQRVISAFSVLGNYPKRREYDGSLPAASPEKTGPDNKAKNGNHAGEPEKSGLKAGNEAAADVQAENLRKSERLKLAIPARVTGYDRNGDEWHEESETIDVSRTGIQLPMKRRVRHRTVVQLSLPLPLELRSHGGPEQGYYVYALVRRVEPPKNGQRVVALEFLGETPPAGFTQKPWATFRTKWTGVERRRRPREEKSVQVAIEYLDEAMAAIGREEAITENLGASGMRVRLSKPAPEFDLVKVIIPGEASESLAALSDKYFDKDGLERLCLRFLGVSATKTSASKPAQKAGSKGKKILVADDDLPLRKVLSKILIDAGYDVVLAEDGKQAVEMAGIEKPDLVIADGLMPKLHGFLACKAIKELPSPPKVIMLTAIYTKKNYRWEARQQYRADDFMTKPFELSELLACVERHLSA
ncbi:MAG TPA: response regulator [Blastocatellia bacterium]|nr:response regulator [Blastocatellia bacterium]